MKIAFVGSHGTGKTAIATFVSQDLKLPLITGVMTELWKEHKIEDFDKLSLKDRARFQKLALSKQILLQEDNPKNYITDRSVLDMLAYSIYLGCLDEEDLVMYKKQAELVCKDYNFIFYLPIMFKFESRDLRATEESQAEVDKIIQSILPNRAIKITSDGLAERLAVIKHEITKPTMEELISYSHAKRLM